MKYVVRCFYCDKVFVVDRDETGADIICPECEKANSIKDVVERIEDTPAKKKEVDSDIAAIKAFDMAQHPVVDDYWERERRRREHEFWGKIIAAAVFFVALIILRFLNFIGVVNF